MWAIATRDDALTHAALTHDGAIRRDIRLIRPDGAQDGSSRLLAIEAPVSIEFNGIAYAVMMATPVDLHDFVTGFALAERIVGSPADLTHIDIVQVEKGWVVRATIGGDRVDQLMVRVRHRVAESSCGLCGMDNLDEVTRPLPPVAQGPAIIGTAIFRALDSLRGHQPLGGATGATHAAAFVTADGTILHAREDVGRHNALDKLVGALAREGIAAASGFLLVSSRCSYEMVEKAVLAGAHTLVAISAPTSLAVERAAQAGLTLVALARSDSAWLLPPDA